MTKHDSFAFFIKSLSLFLFTIFFALNRGWKGVRENKKVQEQGQHVEKQKERQKKETG